MNPRLQDDAALKTEVDAVMAGSAASKVAQDWYARLAAFFAEVKAGVPGKLHDTAFLKRLWDDNPVAATGNGTVKVDAALADAEFQTWFATEVAKPLAPEHLAAQAQLTELFDSLHTRMQVLCGRTPRLKISRVMCALYPEHFTSIADRGALSYLHQEMGGSASDHPVGAHRAIRTRLDLLLGPVASDNTLGQMQRVCLPWMLYERVANDSGSDPSPAGDEPELRPLPASLRRKGLTALKGSFQTLLGFMEDLREGLTRDEFAALVKQANPDYAPQTVAMIIAIVAREFGLCKREGDTYRLSARGINFAQTQDPDEFADLLLTKVLGVDHVLKRLQSGGEGKAALLAMLQDINPGWTTVTLPSALMAWLASLDLIEPDGAKKCRLTERGRRWAERITWVPEPLPKVVDFQPDEPAAATSTSTATATANVASLSNAIDLPSMAEVSARLEQSTQGVLIFPPRLVAQLHAGLWSHPVRHFAVLTGISGSGKTQLALRYAHALCSSTTGNSVHVRVIPVQPGWYDPSALLGYVNPIQEASYRSAPFLELLLRAAADPQQPYVVILDEMNLSHPEQYLAPVLSAMETHGWIDLHSLGEESTAVPMRVRYPANLALIGTVNMDETTHGLSDKVLDRAYTLEFWDIAIADFPGWSGVALPGELKDRTRQVLGELGIALAPVRLHFGWRTIDDVLRYLVFQTDTGAIDADALDHVVYAKVLPKLRGDASQRFQTALQDTCDILKRHGLQRCLAKVQAMQGDLLATGSARFWR